MSTQPIKTEVDQLLAQANDKVRRAEQRLAGGSDEQKVKAAGELVALKQQQAALEARAAELAITPEHHTLVQWFKEDWMILMQRLDAVLDR